MQTLLKSLVLVIVLLWAIAQVYAQDNNTLTYVFLLPGVICVDGHARMPSDVAQAAYDAALLNGYEAELTLYASDALEYYNGQEYHSHRLVITVPDGVTIETVIARMNLTFGALDAECWGNAELAPTTN